MNVLFLGDSITDCDHSFTEDNLGNGYVKKLSLLSGITAVNGGTDGFTFPDVLRKWRLMYAKNRYDCIVVTCGINDVGVITVLEEAGRHEDASVFLDESMAALRALLGELTDMACAQTPSAYVQALSVPALPSDSSSHGSGILLLEPFLFPIPQARGLWLPALQKVRDRIQETITDFNERQASLSDAISPYATATVLAQYIPTQAALNGLAEQIGPPAITADGIHLTDIGHECLAKLVADAFESLNGW